jgi:hypothetical protein
MLTYWNLYISLHSKTQKKKKKKKENKRAGYSEKGKYWVLL